MIVIVDSQTPLIHLSCFKTLQQDPNRNIKWWFPLSTRFWGACNSEVWAAVTNLVFNKVWPRRYAIANAWNYTKHWQLYWTSQLGTRAICHETFGCTYDITTTIVSKLCSIFLWQFAESLHVSLIFCVQSLECSSWPHTILAESHAFSGTLPGGIQANLQHNSRPPAILPGFSFPGCSSKNSKKCVRISLICAVQSLSSGSSSFRST